MTRRLSIDELMGFGVGCIGLSVADFDRLTPDEFGAVAEAWQQNRDRDEHTSWEVARTVAAIVIRPHIRKGVAPKKLLPLPWDHNPAAGAQKKAPKLSREQQEARFDELLRRFG